MSNYDPTRHEPRSDSCEWSEQPARATVAEIAEESVRAYHRTDGYPAHPREDGLPPGPAFYIGASGVLWTLWYLHRKGYTRLDEEWLIDMLTPLVERCEQEVAKFVPAMACEVAYLFGRMPILMMLVELTGEDRWREALIGEVGRSVDAPVRELMWGRPGVLTATHLVADQTVRDEIAHLNTQNIEKLFEAWSVSTHGVRVLKEELYGGSKVFNGAVHGMAGQIFPLLQRRSTLPGDMAERATSDARRWLFESASRGEHGTNWAPEFVPHGTDTAPFASSMMLQICHGAPGVIVCCRHLESDPEVDELLAEGAELTWHAGPLSKGAGLCHGAAGNGYAFLDLFERTGETLWLERARMFAATFHRTVPRGGGKAPSAAVHAVDR